MSARPVRAEDLEEARLAEVDAEFIRDFGPVFASWLPWQVEQYLACLLYTSPSPRDGLLSRMPSSA